MNKIPTTYSLEIKIAGEPISFMFDKIMKTDCGNWLSIMLKGNVIMTLPKTVVKNNFELIGIESYNLVRFVDYKLKRN